MNLPAPVDARGHRERLRQRFLDEGERALHDHELVEYLLTVTVRRGDTKALAKRLIAQFGGYAELLEADVGTLRREGLSEAQIGALKIAQASARRLLETRTEGRDPLISWQAVCDYLHAKMAWRGTEEVRGLFLDTRNRLIANERLFEGTVDESAVHVREVLARALALNASALILVHNHPSGDPSPSRADIRLTRELAEAARPLRIQLHDHVIVGAMQAPLSLRAAGHL
ncbi:RadC family protein [Sphingomicrobium astaxanthinifaciens]|uniref:RadC family protein n=1 Tax=Sphingomicrobium astaxanthinifaciens TaxID=1227949 RepID=UPI001FCA701E|nr:DNA repair protein RadC [Sphingomicrobium astaxanthinifaciens]MCJ7421940.1 DNA repair protein RadC [Sphingomicrobium astaxanthinifaciens]